MTMNNSSSLKYKNYNVICVLNQLLKIEFLMNTMH